MKKIAIGAGLGFVAGCTAGVVRTAVTLGCPALWVPGNAATFGLMAYELSKKNIPITVAATAVGVGVGVAELAAYPVFATLSLAEAACLPAIGTVAGAALMYKS